MRRTRCGFLTCSLIASTALISTAQAADLHSGSSTRNWGGTWFGFGIGHSNHAYKGDYGSTACFTSGTFSGEANYESNCQAEFDPSTGEAGVGVSANASSNGVQAVTAAASGVQSPNNAASVGAAATLEGNPVVNVSVSVDPSVPTAGVNAVGDYADFEATSRTGFEYNDQQSTSTAEAFDTKSGHAWGGVVGGGVSAFMNDDTVVSLEGLYYNFDKDIRFEDGSVKLDDAFSVMVKVSIRPN